MSEPSTPSTSASSPSLSSTDTPPPPGTPPNLHQNTIDPNARWVVQKYGGTSVGKFAAQIAENIVPYAKASFSLPRFRTNGRRTSETPSDYLDRYRLAIVCSARSGSTKSLGTTNLLLRAASEALQRPVQVSSPVQSGAATPLITPFVSRGTRTSSPPGTVDVLVDQNAECVSFNKTVNLIHSEHIAAARDCVKGKEILSELETEIDRDCENLRAFLYAAQVRVSRWSYCAFPWRADVRNYYR
jgi:aspartate kinase